MSNLDHTIPSFGTDDLLLGRYRLDRVLGQGGMGAVWLAHDTQLDRLVAIKLLPAALCRDKRSIARLKEEAKRNLDLTHPNIVRLHTFEQDPARGNAAFLVMQYVEGETLNDLLAEHPKGLPLDRVRPWFEQVGLAIDFAHSKGVLHRDIKPANIMIEAETGTAYLMDFGIAAEARDTMTRVTGVQDSSGTLPYMSPQQLMGKNDKSNDVYSFAVTLYEALCGKPPFHSGDIAYQIRHAEPEPITGMPKAVNTSLQAGLHKVPGQRHATCLNLVRAFAQAIASTVATQSRRTGGGGGRKTSKSRFQQLCSEAEAGNPNAQANLGCCYEDGSGVAKDQAEAVRWYRMAAGQGHAGASVLLGRCHRDGTGVAKDEAEAVHWFRMGADQGDCFAQMALGHCYRDGRGVAKDQAEAVRWYRMAADQGHARAWFWLARCYIDGTGVAKDEAEAVRWYRMAADQGNADAQFNLGVMYAQGCGVRASETEAVNWIRKAADQGNAEAQFNLGAMYKKGRGVPQSDTEAVSWFRKAADQGNVDAQSALIRAFGV